MITELDRHACCEPPGDYYIGYWHKLTDAELSSGVIVINGESVPWPGGISQTQASRLLEQDSGGNNE